MANDGRELTFIVDNYRPIPDSLTVNAGGGNWRGGTYTFKVVAWYYTDDDESNEETGGFHRETIGMWDGIVISITDSVTITWGASTRPPDHYSVYYLENATWTADGILRGRKIAEVNGDVLTATIVDQFVQTGSSAVRSGTCTAGGSTTSLKDSGATFSADMVGKVAILNTGAQDEYALITGIVSTVELTTAILTGSAEWDTNFQFDIVDNIFIPRTTARVIVVNPIKDLNPGLRETMVKDYRGIMVSKSYAQASPVETMEMETYKTSFANMADYQWFMAFHWLTTRIRIEESPAATPIVGTFFGYIRRYDYWGTKYKSTTQVIRLEIFVEIATEA